MATFDDFNRRLDELDLRIIKLSAVEDFDTIDSIQSFRAEYKQIVAEINEISEAIKKDRRLPPETKKTLEDKCQSRAYDIDWVYEQATISTNELVLYKTDDLEKKLGRIENNIRNAQGMQLAVFSIVLTILAFVLTNAKILAASEIDFKNVLLVNVSYLLSADIFFSLIYLFMGPVFHQKSTALRYLILVVAPIFLTIALVLIAIFM